MNSRLFIYTYIYIDEIKERIKNRSIIDRLKTKITSSNIFKNISKRTHTHTHTHIHFFY